MKMIWKYLTIPAIALVLTMMVYNWLIRPVNKGEIAQEAASSGQVQIGGAFELTNQRGETVKDTDFRGKLMLVYFGFTHCPDICPTDVKVMSDVMDELGEQAGEVQPVFITVDPERDTPERMGQFVQSFYPGIQALTGAQKDVYKALAEYRVFYRKVEGEKAEDYRMEHSGYTYLMGRNTEFLTHFRHGQNAGEIAKEIKKYL